MKAARHFCYVFIITVITAGALMIGCESSGTSNNNCKGIDQACSNNSQCCSGLNCRYTGGQGGYLCQDY